MNIKFLFLLMSLLVISFLSVGQATAEVSSDVNNDINIVTYPDEQPNDRETLKLIILHRLTVWTRPRDNVSIYAYTCRNSHFGCEGRIETLVNMIFEEASKQKFDPWLVAAMAWHESHFNPFAVSNQNAFGVLQMLRRSRWSHGLRFVHNPRYRSRCRNIEGECQREIIERSIYWTRRSIAACGSIQGGLRMYNSGHCDGPRRYPRIVLGLQRRFLLQAEEYMRNERFIEEENNYIITCDNTSLTNQANFSL